MSATVVPFRRPDQHKAEVSLADLQAQTRHDTRRTCMDCETLREESERIRRGYEERQKTIDRLLADIHRNSERA